MKLHEKIRKIRKEKGISLRELQKRLSDIFGAKALRYNTLYRIEKGMRDARIGSLSQISIGLGISLKELKEGTEEYQKSLGECVTKSNKTAEYIYSEKASAQILTSDKQSFLGLRLILGPGGKTKLEQDPAELGKFEKFVYILKGKITCVIGEERLTLRKDETFCFDSSIPHYFENNTLQRSSCLVFQNPRHL